jgi:hypothetical protein
MITYNKYLFTTWHGGQRADQRGDTGMGNLMYFIAGTIGIAVRNGYEYGFPNWVLTPYLKNELPFFDDPGLPEINIEWGFHGFDYPDNVSLCGQMQSPKFFNHCIDLIRHHFELKDVAEPYKDTIVMHYRNYVHPYFHNLTREYYLKALQKLPDRRVIVITDDIDAARKAIGENSFEYVSNTPIVDFYLGVKADYKVIANSSFSCWWAYLNGEKVVAPYRWYSHELKQSPAEIYHPNWIKV